MMHSSLSFFLVIALDGGGGGTPDPDWVGANEVSGLSCDDDDDDDDDEPSGAVTLPSFEQHEADPLGGYWWVRLDPGMRYIELDTLELVGVERDVRYPVSYRESGVWLEAFLSADLSTSLRSREASSEEYTVLALQSPADAVPGESFELRRASSTIAVLGVRSSATPIAALESLSITLDGMVAEKCDARCHDDGISIPRSPILRIEYQGDPVVLDLRLTATCDGAYGTDLFVDAFELTETDGAIRVYDPRDFGLQGDCTISHAYTNVFDPDTRTNLLSYPYDEVGTLEEAPSTLFEDGEPVEREPCGFLAGTIWDRDTRMRDFGLPCACVVAEPSIPSAGLVAGAGVVVIAMRRRRRSPRTR